MDYKKYFSKIAYEMKPSGIRKYFDIAATMPDCISLGVGEPNFVTPEVGCKAAIKSIEDGITRYTSNSGLIQLRKLISRYMETRYGLSYNPDNEIITTVGVSEGIDIAFMALLNPGDEVLLPEPCFVSYAPAVLLAGGVPVVVKCVKENGFIITPEMLEEKITPKTKAILMCYPNNPTGAIMTKEQLQAVAPVFEKHDLIVLSDEVYSELTYGGLNHVSIASLPRMRERTIVFNGFSKGFAMTGWRLGYVCAPKEIIEQVLKIHQYMIMCAPTAAQYAAAALLEDGLSNDFARGVRPQTQIPLPLSRGNGFGVLRAERRVLYVPERGEHGCGRRNLCREAYTRIQGLLPRRHSLRRSGLLPHQDKLCLRYGTDRKRRRAYGEVCKTAALGNEIIKNALKGAFFCCL